MVSVAYMDPGNYATGVTAGASNQFSLLFITLVSSIMAAFLQALCIKLGTVTGYDLARCSREHLPKKLNYVLWFLAEAAIIATDVAEVIGSAVALNILLRIPLPAGVVITIVDVLVVLAAYRSDSPLAHIVRYFEYAVGLLVLGIVACLAAVLAYLPTGSAPVGQVFRGFLPSKEMFEGHGMTIATSMVGATVMVHSLFLGSGIVQPRLREYDVTHGIVELPDSSDKKQDLLDYFYTTYTPSYHAIRYCLKFSIIELVVTLMTFALFVNAAIVIMSGAVLYGTPEAVDADLYTIHDLLLETLAPVVGTLFMLALLLSGQSAGIVCTMAGQMVSEGHLRWTVRPWVRRLVTRSISILPCLVISVTIGKDALNSALNVSQIVISLLLPPLTAPLIYFTCSKRIMRVEKPAESNNSLELETMELETLEQENGSVEVGNSPENGQVESLEQIAESSAANQKRQLDRIGTAETHTVAVVHDNASASDWESNAAGYWQMENNWLTTGLVVLIWLFITVLNVYAIVQMAKDGILG